VISYVQGSIQSRQSAVKADENTNINLEDAMGSIQKYNLVRQLNDLRNIGFFQFKDQKIHCALF